jgi:uncharacterized protein (TIGR02231 family)
MKAMYLLGLALFLLPVAASGEEPVRIPVLSRITAVTVYQDRAMTTRSATLTLKPGSYLAVFDGLPTLIQDDSVRVAGRGSAATTIVGMEVKRSFLEQVPEKRARELEQEILDLEHKLGGVEARKSSLTAQKSFVESIRVAWGDRISKELAVGKPTAGELQEALTFVANAITRVEEQSRDLDEEKQRLKDRIDAVRRQRDDAIGSRRKEAKSVVVSLEVTREGSLELEMGSVTSQAGWEPSYDARLASDGASAELLFRAMVRQQSGEEWRDVELTLSTARPASGSAPPELTPWRVSLYQPAPPAPPAAPAPLRYEAVAKSARPQAARTGMAGGTGDGVPPAEAEVMTTRVFEEQNSISFRVPRPVTIPTDGTRHGNVVATEILPLKLEFLTVPKLAPNVYLKSEVVNRAPYPLLPGRINIFSGGNFIGTSQVKRVASGEKFDLFFGTDDQVTVKREELKSHKEAGLFGKNRMGYRYLVKVQNFRKEPQTITVLEQLPLAGNEEITVTLDEPSQEPSERKPDGTVIWKLPVRAGEKKEISYGIIVEYPKDRQITGL